MVAGIGGVDFTLGSVRRSMNRWQGPWVHRAGGHDRRTLEPDRAFAALVFGFADSLQVKLSILRTPIPSQFLPMASYLATILVVAGTVHRAWSSAADGKPYVKE
jgi:simple sugar transport system permease protein